MVFETDSSPTRAMVFEEESSPAWFLVFLVFKSNPSSTWVAVSGKIRHQYG